MSQRFIFLLIFIGFTSCNSSGKLYNLPAITKKGNIQAVIEIPAGTNAKIEYRKEEQKFITEKENGKKRKIDFLPYPGNYGFIPSTFSNPEKGGDGDALDVLVISEALKTGTAIEIIPLGMLKLIDEGEEDYKIIGVPAQKSKQVIKADNFRDFSKNYPQIKLIIETWFRYYDKEDSLKILGWEDEKAAYMAIRKSQKTL